jgi:hypothetical protein
VTDFLKSKGFKPIPVVFKTVPGGYVYRAPNAWLFGSGNHYLVNEAQKAEILAIFKKPTQETVWVAILLWIVISALLAEAAALWVWAAHQNPILTGLSAIVSFPFLLYVGALISRRFLLRRLRPVLIQLPATDERITDLEENQAIAIAASSGPISLTLRRGLKICSIVGVPLALASMILPTIEMYQRYPSMLVAFLTANNSLSGLLSLMGIVALLFMFAVGCAYKGGPKVGPGHDAMPP